MTKFKLAIAVAALGVATSASAALSAYDQGLLSLLSPAKQKEVLARAVNGNTVDGVITTMLLNQISGEFAAGNVLAVDNDDGVIVVSKNGKTRAFQFDVVTLVLKNPNQ